MNWAASLWLAVAFGNCILAIILATYLHTSIPKWIAAYRYRGRHRGVYKPPVEPRVSLLDKEMVYLGDVLHNITFYGVISDSEPAMMTATLEIGEPRLDDDDEWYGPMDFGVPPGLPCRPELGPHEHREHFA